MRKPYFLPTPGGGRSGVLDGVRTVPRQRRYVSHGAIVLCRPLLSFDYGRAAYVLKGVGRHRGPVLREERRRGDFNGYSGPERRGSAVRHPL